MINRLINKYKGFTLVELLVLISIAGLMIVLLVVVFNAVRINGRDTARVDDITAIKRALAVYIKDSSTGYPFSGGECLSVASGPGQELIDSKTMLTVPADPLWPSVSPEQIDGLPDAGQNNFCYFYYSDTGSNYKLSYFLESNSKAGSAGVNTTTQ